MSRSDLTLRKRLELELADELYECNICIDVVFVADAVFACDTCHAVSHLRCVDEWASTQSEQWRCPSCPRLHLDIPEGACYCGKALGCEEDPYEAWFDPPHSCGLTCGRGLSCGHECEDVCHPGPCSPCLQSVTSTCGCGASEVTHVCSDPIESVECDAVCDLELSCQSHLCMDQCHGGPCKKCAVSVTQTCTCGKDAQTISCNEAFFNPNYSCGRICDKPYACGNHACEEVCHIHGSAALPCPKDPTILLKCPCGARKFSIKESLDTRTSCEASVILCDDVCWNQMKCGHCCKQQCHEGPCTVCLEKVEMFCKCQSTSTTRICSDASETEIACKTLCRRSKNCGRHHCQQKCCPRDSIIYDNENDDPHYCGIPCDRMLKCGKHQCQLECHRGPCPPCLEANFESVSCACGNTVLEPPIPCGSNAYPPCSMDCIAKRVCGHDASIFPHTCHPPSEPCPPCKFLVERICKCGNNSVKSTVCSSVDLPSCGRACGKVKLACSHPCTQICHVEPCLEECTVLCGQQRKCGHVCMYPCHAGKSCVDAGACGAMMTLKCKCGIRSIRRSCGQVSHARAITRKWLLDKENGALGVYPSPVDADGDLWCNAECEAMAKPENRTVFYTPELVEYAEKHLEFTQLITTAFSNLLQASHKFHTFAPMKLIQRDFIEALAEHYGIPTETEGEDPEAIIVAQRVLASTRPAILLTSAIDLKKRGLLLYSIKEEDVDQPPINDSSVERQPKLTKGFARPMAVPAKETIKLSNAFDLLQQGNE